MSTINRVLLLIGSPRGGKSTSARLAHLLAAGLTAPGITIDELALTTALRTPERQAALLVAADQADLIVLAAPIYVDGLPAPVVRALEALAAHWEARPAEARRQRFAALTNCGFPEALHCETALQICAQFARETGLAWRGGIAVGGGGMVHSLLEDPAPAAPGKPTRRLSLGMRAAAAALRADQPIPAEALAQIARPIVPHRLYTLIATVRWHLSARSNRVWGRLRRRPYEAPETP